MSDRRWIWAGATLGFGLGGFFDGILLHQILQWHHLLSLVPGIADIRMQVMWDGIFHALMYVIAVWGLVALWRAQRGTGVVSGGVIAGALLVGFGAWNVVDILLAHWIVGIHRVKLDSPNPLAWDVGWLVVFGLAPLLIGWRMIRGGGGAASARTVVAGLALLTVGTGAWSLRPPPDMPLTAIVFRPSVDAAQAAAILDDAGARVVWADPAMSVVLVDVPRDRRWSFYGKGAMLVSGSGVPAGCFNWSRA
jgi:uncharacterized membrane protein